MCSCVRALDRSLARSLFSFAFLFSLFTLKFSPFPRSLERGRKTKEKPSKSQPNNNHRTEEVTRGKKEEKRRRKKRLLKTSHIHSRASANRSIRFDQKQTGRQQLASGKKIFKNIFLKGRKKREKNCLSKQHQRRRDGHLINPR